MIPPYVERLRRPAVIIDAEVFSEMVDQSFTILPKNGIGGVHLKALWEEMMHHNRNAAIWEDFTASLENLVEVDPAKYHLECGTATWAANVEFGIEKNGKYYCYLIVALKGGN